MGMVRQEMRETTEEVVLQGQSVCPLVANGGIVPRGPFQGKEIMLTTLSPRSSTVMPEVKKMGISQLNLFAEDSGAPSGHHTPK